MTWKRLDRHLCSCHGTPDGKRGDEQADRRVRERARKAAHAHAPRERRRARSRPAHSVPRAPSRHGVHAQHARGGGARARGPRGAPGPPHHRDPRRAHEESRRVLATRAAHLAHVVSKPPSELAPSLMRGEHAKRMDTDLLRKLVRPETPQEVKHELANRWADNHGAYARCCISEAIQRLQSWSPEGHAGFIRVLRQLSEREVAQLLAEPEARACWACSCVSRPQLGSPRRCISALWVRRADRRCARARQRWRADCALRALCGRCSRRERSKRRGRALGSRRRRGGGAPARESAPVAHRAAGAAELGRYRAHACARARVRRRVRHFWHRDVCGCELRAFSLKRIYDVFQLALPTFAIRAPELVRDARALCSP